MVRGGGQRRREAAVQRGEEKGARLLRRVGPKNARAAGGRRGRWDWVRAAAAAAARAVAAARGQISRWQKKSRRDITTSPHMNVVRTRRAKPRMSWKALALSLLAAGGAVAGGQRIGNMPAVRNAARARQLRSFNQQKQALSARYIALMAPPTRASPFDHTSRAYLNLLAGRRR